MDKQDDENPCAREIAQFYAKGTRSGGLSNLQKLGLAFLDLRIENARLAGLLQEWRRTPFFETEEDWRAWVDDFGSRVDAALLLSVVLGRRHDGTSRSPAESKESCEGCGSPATHYDADYIPLCSNCYEAMVADHKRAAPQPSEEEKT